MLLGLDTDPYSYDDITDNSWPFKTKNRGKENEYISPHSISGSHVCESIFKSCPLIQMTRPSDSTNLIQSMNLFTYTRVLTFFCRYTWAFCLDLFESVLFPDNNADSVPTVYLSFLDDMLNVPKEGYDWGQTVLSCLYFNLSQSCLEPADCITGLLLLLQMWLWTQFPIGRPR
jgi:Plant mobile domain